MPLTYQQALDQLTSLRQSGNLNESTLRQLVSSLSIEAEGSLTVFYGGTVNNVKATDIAKEMAKDPNIRILDKTDAALFLDIENNKAFANALIEVFGDSPSDPGTRANAFLFGEEVGGVRTPNGAWDNISGRFADATTGKVKILAENPRAFGVLLQTELPKLLEKFTTGTGVTEIEGLTREKLVGFSDLTDLRNTILTKAAYEAILAKPTTSSFSAFVRMTDETFLAMYKTAAGVPEDLVKLTEATQRFKIGSKVLKALPMIGTAFFILSALTTSAQAAQASAEGRSDEALHLLEDFGAEWAGSTVAEVAAGAIASAGLLLAGVALTTPVGMATVLVASVAGGYFGGDWGKELLHMFQGLNEDRKRDTAKRMLKLLFGDNVSLSSTVPEYLAAKSLTIDSTFSEAEIVDNAKADIAWRYALRELNSFVIPGDALYEKHNKDGSLDLYDAATGEGTMTEKYLQDRSAFLYHLANPSATSDDNIEFFDASTGVVAYSNLSLPAETRISYLFGGTGSNELTGDDQADHLYGMGGIDVLTGGKGNDYLEGGRGIDIYAIYNGDGQDIITDKENNILQINGETFAGVFVKEQGSSSYTYTNGSTSYNLSFGANGAILTLDGTTSLTFANQTSAADFAEHDFGITLMEAPPETTLTLTGDANRDEMSIIDIGTNPANWQLYYTSFPTPTTGTALYSGPFPSAAPRIFANGGDGADFLFGFLAHDEIFGGDGNDMIMGDLGTWNGKPVTMTGTPEGDLLDGGAGNDWIQGTGSIDQLIGGEGNDLLSGFDEDDSLRGDAGNDVLAGGSHSDTITGGAGDDILLGDGYITGSLSLTLDNLASLGVMMTASATGYYTGYTTINYALHIDAPNGGNDYLIGGAGRDWLEGGAGDDVLDGGTESDSLLGNDGNDWLYGGDGDDWLVGDNGNLTGNGNDVLDGGLGNDLLYGLGGNDTLVGDDGNDQLYGFDGDDFLDGGLGNDKLDGGIGSDIIFGGQGNDTLSGQDGQDTLFGDEGDDSINGQYGTDALYGGIGNDYLYGGVSNDTLNGDEGDDFLYGQEDADTLSGGDGNDLLSGDAGDDILSGGTGNDTLSGGVGNDTFQFNVGDGQDYIQDDGGSDTLAFGIDIVLSDLQFFLSTNNGLVIKVGETGDQVTLANWFNSNTARRLDSLSFADGTVVASTQLFEQRMLNGTPGDDVYFNYDQYHWIDGGDGNDTLQGTNSDDILKGGAGNDTLDAYDGDDELTGGPGNDLISGGYGNNIYRFNLGDGQDAIGLQGQFDTQVHETLAFGAGISLSEMQFFTASGDLIIKIGDNGDQITLNDWFTSSRSYFRLDSFSFADGTVLTVDQFFDQKVVMGTGGADTIYGADASNDRFDGGGGDDEIRGASGGDILKGGAGADTLYGDADADTLYGGLGNDILWGGTGDDVFQFNLGDGQDTIRPVGNNGVDTLSFGQGITAAALRFLEVGYDLIIKVGDADDQVKLFDWNAPGWSDTRIDRLTFADGTVMTRNQLLAKKPVYGTAGADTLSGVGADNNWFDGGSGNDTLLGNGGNDILQGGDGNDVLQGGIGNDDLVGGAGDDIFRFNLGDGKDAIYDSTSGIDTLAFGSGITSGDLNLFKIENDLVIKFGSAGDQVTLVNWYGTLYWYNTNYHEHRFSFADGSVISTGTLLDQKTVYGTAGADTFSGIGAANDWFDGGDGDDVLNGNYGNDDLSGGAGNDTLSGGVGDDIIRFNLGDGQDTVSFSGGGTDILAFGPGISPSSLQLLKTGDDLVIEVGNAGDQITLEDYCNTSPNGIPFLMGASIDRFTFADNTITLSNDDIFALGMVVGTANSDTFSGIGAENDWFNGDAGDDTLFGNDGNDLLKGGLGNDNLQGGSGNDELIGGPGNDILSGGTGSNVFRYNFGDGQDTINFSGSDTNTLDFGPGITLSSLQFFKIGTYDLLILVGEEGDQVTLTNWFNSSSTGFYALDYFSFSSDNRFLIRDTLLERKVVRGTDGDDIFYGNNPDSSAFDFPGDWFDGGAGNDTLYGYRGDDILDGGVGADTLRGGMHDDTYIVDNIGDVVIENRNEGTDTVQASISYTLAGYTENLTLTGTLDINGTGSELDNAIVGNSGANILSGGLGNDILTGGAGNDIYIFNRGDNQDSIRDLDKISGVDILRFGPGITDADVLAIKSGNDLVFKIKDSTDQISCINYYAVNATAGNEIVDNRVNRVEFANNVVWDQSMIQAAVGHSNNHAPTINTPLPALQALPGTPFTTTVPATTITDPDSWDSITYSVKMPDGSALPAWLTFNAATRTLSGTPNINDVGSLQFILRGTDIYNLFAEESVTLNVLPPNRAPIVSTALLDLITPLGSVFSYSIAPATFTDPDAGDVLSYNATLVDGSALPPWLSFDAPTQTFSGTPPTLGSISVRVTATDKGQLSVSDVFDLTVNLQDLTLLGTAGEDTLNGGAGNDTVSGLAGNDTLIGAAGNDILNGGTGADTMVGGLGNDAYIVDNTGDIVTENVNEGTDTVLSSITYTLGSNVENLTITDSSAINGTGNSLNNVLIGNSAANTLNGGSGVDTMSGGLGDDIYLVDNTGDVVTENAGEGTDLVQSSVTYTLFDNVENLTLTGTTAINGTGNELDNVLLGNSNTNTLIGGSGNDTLNGGAGTDTMLGGVGNDTYLVDNTGDVVTENANEGTDTIQTSVTYTLSANIENLTLTGTSALNGTGNASNNTLTGNTGANVLNGGAGIDTMIGGQGNDTYVVDNIGDTVTENASEGTDLVQSIVTYTLGANLENLTLTGTAAINATGNVLNNTLTGNSADNIFNGGAGTDTMIGGQGNDTYIVDVTTDVVTENASEGTDTVQSSITYTLGSNVENLTLTGASVINGTGNTLNNILMGNSANNTLSGGSGADTMVGGLGDDIFVVDNTGDVVTENASEGTDLVQASVTYTLSTNVENLTLTGTTALNGTGNAANNILIGNAGVNVLNGGAGADTMIGGQGNDTYVVDNLGDVVTENASAGTDLVQSGVTYTLGANIENLTLTGTAVINATGNALNNKLTGNTADNILNGGAGTDTMIGGQGNDTYVVDVSTDVVTESASQGTDTVQSSITYTLGSNVENLTLTGSAAINGTGNTLNNILVGNSGANTLSGGSGIDTLKGGLGNDTLTGGAGNDVFVFDTALNASTNKDTLSDFTVGQDKVQLSNSIFTALTTTGTLNSANFRSSTNGVAADSNDYFLYNTTSGALLYDADGNGQGVAVQFATLTTKPQVTANDFLVAA